MLRLAASFALLSAWLVLLLLGWAFGGAVYALLIAALAVFPWRELRGGASASGRDGSPPAGGPSSAGR